MKEILEKVFVFVVIILVVLIIGLITKYNMISDDVIQEFVFVEKIEKKSNKNYLSSLEGYGDDTDVKVDSSKENNVNVVSVKAEESNEDLEKALDDKDKSSYLENLSQFSPVEEVETKKVIKAKIEKIKKDSEGVKTLPDTEDKIGSEIDDLLSDL